MVQLRLQVRVRCVFLRCINVNVYKNTICVLRAWALEQTPLHTCVLVQAVVK